MTVKLCFKQLTNYWTGIIFKNFLTNKLCFSQSITCSNASPNLDITEGAAIFAYYRSVASPSKRSVMQSIGQKSIKPFSNDYKPKNGEVNIF